LGSSFFNAGAAAISPPRAWIAVRIETADDDIATRAGL
jgi:hypothetical protein